MKPTRTPLRWRGCLLGVAVLSAMVLLAGIYLWLYVDYTGPTQARAPRPGEHSPDQAPYTLSAEQRQVVDELGYPDAFTLLFYQDLDEQDRYYDIRYESWQYGAVGREVVFVNGELIRDVPAEAVPPALAATPYRPEQFAASMRLNDVLASAGIAEYARAAADPLLVPSAEICLARQLAFGLKDGRLMAVETLPVAAEG